MEAMQKMFNYRGFQFSRSFEKTFRNAKKTVLHRKPARSEEACCSSGRCPHVQSLWQMSGI